MTSSALPQTLAILGPGLLGGSLALKWRQRCADRGLLLWGRKESSLHGAREIIPDRCLTTDLAEVAARADMVVLATPVGSMMSLVKQLLEHGLKPGTVITDVGSVKAMVHRQVDAVLDGSGMSFVGSHPMAGSEQTGFGAARADLFIGAACVITGEAGPVSAVSAFWETMGCRCYAMSPEAHDDSIARVSHLPHLLACVGAIAALGDRPELGEIAGGGLRDTTRVASGDPDLWAEILIENRQALMAPIADAMNQLRDVLAILDSNDQESLKRWLLEAKSLRDPLRHFFKDTQ